VLLAGGALGEVGGLPLGDEFLRGHVFPRTGGESRVERAGKPRGSF
jgi:hypothetical protein